MDFLSDVIQFIEEYNLDQFLFLIPILLVGLWFGFVGFTRGVRKASYKATLGIFLLILAIFLLGPITHFVSNLNIRFILETFNINSIWDPQIFTGSVSLNGLIEYNLEKALELDFSAQSLTTIYAIVQIVLRFVVLIVVLIVFLPLINAFISFFRWLFFRDAKVKRSIERHNQKLKENEKPLTFRKHRLWGWSIGFTYGLIVCLILILPMMSFIGTLDKSIQIADTESNLSQKSSLTQELAENGEWTDILKTIKSFANKLDNTGFMSLINQTNIDDFAFDQIFYVETKEGTKANLRQEFEILGNLLALYMDNPDNFSNFNLTSMLELLSDKKTEDLMLKIKDSELITQFVDVALHDGFKAKAIKNKLLEMSIDLEFLEEAASTIHFKNEIENLTIIMTRLATLFKDQDFGNLNYLGLNEVLFNEVMQALFNSKLVTDLALPIGLDVLKNQEMVKSFIEKNIITNEELEGIFNDVNKDIFTTIGSLYNKVIELDLNSKTLKEDLFHLSDTQYDTLNDFVATAYDNPLISKVTTLAFKYLIKSVEELKDIEFNQDINFENDVKELLNITKVVFRVEGFDVNSLDLMNILDKMTTEDVTAFQNSLKNMTMYPSLSIGLGNMLSKQIGSTFPIPEDVNWEQEIDTVFMIFSLLKQNEIQLDLEDPTKIITNLLVLDDLKLAEFGNAFGTSDLFIGIIKKTLNEELQKQNLSLNFNEVTSWRDEIANILIALKPFGDFGSLNFNDFSSLLSKINPEKICKSGLLKQALNQMLKKYTEGDQKVLVANFSENQTYEEFMNLHIEDLLTSALVLLYDEQNDTYLNLDNLDITTLLKKFYHFNDLSDPLQKRKEILNSRILFDSIIYQIEKIQIDQIVIPTDIDWGNKEAGELNQLLNALEYVLPSGNLNEFSDVNKIVIKLYDENNRANMLNSRIIIHSVKKMVEDLAVQDNPMIYIPTGMNETDWKNEINHLLSSLKIITANSTQESGYDNFNEIDLNASIRKFEEKNTRDVLFNSSIIYLTIRKNIEKNPILKTERLTEDDWKIELDFFFNAVFIILGENASLENIAIDFNAILEERAIILKSLILEATLVNEIQNNAQIPGISIPTSVLYSDFTEVKWYRNYADNTHLVSEEHKSEMDFLLDAVYVLLLKEDQTLGDINLLDVSKMIKKFVGDEKTVLLKSDIIKSTLIQNVENINQIKKANFKMYHQNKLWDAWSNELPLLLEGVNVIVEDALDNIQIDINKLLSENTRNTILKSRILEETIVEEVKIQVNENGSLYGVVKIPVAGDFQNTAPIINWYRQYSGDTITLSEIDYLLRALEMLLTEGSDVSGIQISKLMSLFSDVHKQDKLLDSILIRNTVIQSIRDASILRKTKMVTWADWSNELPKFFMGIHSILGDNGDLNQFTDININAILNSKDQLLYSDILEETMIEEFKLQKPSLLLEPTGFEDYTWNEQKYYRTQKVSETEFIESEFDKLIHALKILLGASDDITLFDPNTMITIFFGEKQAELLKSDIIKASIISSIKNISVLKFEDAQYQKQVLLWSEWSEELPLFFKAIQNVIGEGNLNQLENISFNLLLNDSSRNILLNSRIIEMTLVQITRENIQGGALKVELPDQTKYADLTEPLNWYRIYDINGIVTAESELNHLFAALRVLISGDNATDFDMNGLLSLFLNQDSRNRLFKSKIIVETFIQTIPTVENEVVIGGLITKTITIFVKPQNPTWSFYTLNNGKGISEIDAFLDAIKIIYGENVTFASLINVNTLLDFVTSGTAEQKEEVNKSSLLTETLNQFSII